MNVIETPLADVFIIEPNVFGDERGFFFESFNDKLFREMTQTDYNFVQDNHSRSRQGILRGLHYQLEPYAQGKLVRVVVGEVFDVAVDIRRHSETFGQWYGVTLSAENKRQFWIPPGFAHGFLTLSEHADFLYKTTNYYSPKYECSIRWNDTDLSINWPKTVTPQLSAKDEQAVNFEDADVFA